MKSIQMLAMYLCVTLPSGLLPVAAQTPNDQVMNALDLKMDLAETKLELLDSKIRLWEDKPAALEMKLRDIEKQVRQLSFSPEEFNDKFMLLDSLMVEQRTMMADQQNLMDEQQVLYDRINENNFSEGAGISSMNEITGLDNSPAMNEITGLNVQPLNKYVISIYPIRLFEGTLQLSLERVLKKGNAIELSLMATYANKEGIANYYVSNQKLDYYNAVLDSYVPYESESISGYGASLAWRNYLLPRTNPKYEAPRGVYAAPTVMYRRLTLFGFDYSIDEETGNTELVEVKQYLNVFSGGILAGWQFVLWNALTADLYLGGMVRLSKYDGDENFTRYKQVRNIDFSGVMPTFGLKIGIVK